VLNQDSRNRIRQLFDDITDFSVIDVRRERIKQIRDRAKSKAIYKAIPSPLAFLSLTRNVRDPVSLIINLVGMTAQSVTSYLDANEQAELKFEEDNLELTVSQDQAVNRLRGGMWDHMAVIATANGLRGNDTVSRSAIEAFVTYKNEKDLPTKLRSLLDLQSTYEKFFPYWLELANTYHAAGRFNDCISAIRRYETLRAPIFRQYCDLEYSETLLRGIDAASKVYQNNPAEYARITLDFLRKIEQTAPIDDRWNWTSRYGAALAYIDLAAAAGPAARNEYLNKAFGLLRGNVRTLSIAQREMLNGRPRDNPKRSFGYLEPIPGKVKTEDVIITALREGRKNEIPPFNEALVTNCRMLYALMDKLNTGRQDRTEIASILNEALFVPITRSAFLDDSAYNPAVYYPVRGSLFSSNIRNTNTGKTIGKWVGGVLGAVGFGVLFPLGILVGNAIGAKLDSDPPQSVELSFPAVFLGPRYTINLRILNINGSAALDDKKEPCNFQDTYCIVKEVVRKNNNLNEFRADVLVPLPNKVKLDKSKEYLMELSLISETGTQTIMFRSPQKNSDFTEFKVVFEK